MPLQELSFKYGLVLLMNAVTSLQCTGKLLGNPGGIKQVENSCIVVSRSSGLLPERLAYRVQESWASFYRPLEQ